MCLPVCLCVVIANHDLSNLDKNSLKTKNFGRYNFRHLIFGQRLSGLFPKLMKIAEVKCFPVQNT